jgi:hypothetical protein
VREPPREAQEVLGRSAGERVDRLVVVADDTEVVALAEPPVEQRDLQRVHVLKLVHRERVEPRADVVNSIRVLVKKAGG